MTSRPKRIILFDMDETLGCFIDINIIAKILHKHIHINEVLQIFESTCFRPYFFEMMDLIVKLKDLGELDKVVLYTNNTGGYSWPSKIVKYIHSKVGHVFDEIIYGSYVNPPFNPDRRRKYVHKDIRDVRDILQTDKNTLFLFFDDNIYENMKDPYMTSIVLTPFRCKILFSDTMKAFRKHPLYTIFKRNLIEQNYESTFAGKYMNEDPDKHYFESIRMLQTIISFVDLNPCSNDLPETK